MQTSTNPNTFEAEKLARVKNALITHQPATTVVKLPPAHVESSHICITSFERGGGNLIDSLCYMNIPPLVRFSNLQSRTAVRTKDSADQLSKNRLLITKENEQERSRSYLDHLAVFHLDRLVPEFPHERHKLALLELLAGVLAQRV